jgi:hypothetical protein
MGSTKKHAEQDAARRALERLAVADGKESADELDASTSADSQGEEQAAR